jgi:hypothetical protein
VRLGVGVGVLVDRTIRVGGGVGVPVLGFDVLVGAGELLGTVAVDVAVSDAVGVAVEKSAIVTVGFGVRVWVTAGNVPIAVAFGLVPIGVTTGVFRFGTGVAVRLFGAAVGDVRIAVGSGTTKVSGVGVSSIGWAVGIGVSVSVSVGVEDGNTVVSVGVAVLSATTVSEPPSGVSVAKFKVGRAFGFDQAATTTLVMPIRYAIEIPTNRKSMIPRVRMGWDQKARNQSSTGFKS